MAGSDIGNFVIGYSAIGGEIATVEQYLDLITSEYKLDHSILFSNVGGNNGGYAPSPSGGPVNALSSILNQGAGTYPGIVGNVIWDSNLFSKVGADAECRLDANVVVTGSIISTNNWDLDTNLAVSCPDLN